MTSTVRVPRITGRALWWGLVAVVGVAGAGFAAWPWLGERVARSFGLMVSADRTQGVLEKLEVYGRVPDFALIERSGKRITLADLKGKIWIADFFYTECTDTCSLQSAHMARLQADLSGEADVRLVSISVDPEHDTPEVLSEYAASLGADPERWLFLTGPREAIYRLAIDGFRLGVVDQGEKARLGNQHNRVWLGPAQAWAHPVPNPARKPIIHSSRFVLVDRQARIRGYYHGTDWASLERLRESVRTLLRERSKEGSQGPATGAEDLFKAMAVQRPANPGSAPDLELPGLDGKTVLLKDFRGKVVLLGFFTTT